MTRQELIAVLDANPSLPLRHCAKCGLGLVEMRVDRPRKSLLRVWRNKLTVRVASNRIVIMHDGPLVAEWEALEASLTKGGK